MTLRDNLDIAEMQRVPPNLRYEFTRAPRYTLQVQGANFVPSARVQMALIDTASMQTLHKASVYAQSPISGVSHGRPVQNPLAGTFQYQTNIQSVPVPADVHLWCRSVDHLDIHNVKME